MAQAPTATTHSSSTTSPYIRIATDADRQIREQNLVCYASDSIRDVCSKIFNTWCNPKINPNILFWLNKCVTAKDNPPPADLETPEEVKATTFKKIQHDFPEEESLTHEDCFLTCSEEKKAHFLEFFKELRNFQNNPAFEEQAQEAYDEASKTPDQLFPLFSCRVILTVLCGLSKDHADEVFASGILKVDFIQNDSPLMKMMEAKNFTSAEKKATMVGLLTIGAAYSHLEISRIFSNTHPAATDEPTLVRYSTFSRTWMMTKDPQVMQRMLEIHRNDGVFFEGSRGYKGLLSALQTIDPSEKFAEKDFMFTCTMEDTIRYRGVLETLFNMKSVEQMKPTIKQLVDDTLRSWEGQKGEINLTAEMMSFASRTISTLILGLPAEDSQINEAVDIIVKALTKPPTIIGEILHLNACSAVFCQKINEVLSNNDSPLMRVMGDDFTRAQKKAMIYTLFIAGQETTAALLIFMIWLLAKSMQLQDELRGNEAKIFGFFLDSLREYPAGWDLPRMVKQDLIVGNSLAAAGEALTAMIISAGAEAEGKRDMSWLPLGHDVHKCPGRVLARNEIILFILALLDKYTIETDQQHDIEKIGAFVLKLAEDIRIKVNSRETTRVVTKM